MVSVDIEGSLGWRLVNGEEFQWPGVAKDEGGTQAGLIWDGDEMLNVDPLFCADRFGEKIRWEVGGATFNPECLSKIRWT